MLKPRKMTRIIILGAKNQLQRTINVLHKLNSLHISDYIPHAELERAKLDKRDTDIDVYKAFRIGKPLPRSSQLSEKLLKIRSLSTKLKLDELPADVQARLPPVGERYRVEELERKLDIQILELESTILKRHKEKQWIEKSLSELDTRLRELSPFATLPLELDAYRGYKNIAVFVGTIRTDPEADIKMLTSDYLLYRDNIAKPSVIALFVPQRMREAVGKVLMKHKYTELPIPKDITGNPRAIVSKLTAQKSELTARRAKLESELAELRERYGRVILASEEHLNIEIEKAESPMRFATTKNSFLIDGWVLTDQFEHIKRALHKATDGNIYMDKIEITEKEEEEAPVKLDNPKPVGPFELLVNVFSTPKYKEIDPSALLFLFFPLFFGFMIGDLGHGLMILIFALYLRGHKIFGIGGKEIGNIFIVCGISAMAFGAIVFAEAFGLPIAPHAHEETWSSLLGVDINLYGFIVKLEDVKIMLLIAIVLGMIHMLLGLIFGFFNEWTEHGLKKAVLVKGGWALVFLGFFLVFGALLGMPFPEAMMTTVYLGPTVYVAGFALVILGAVMVALVEAQEIIEILGPIANIFSYTRLAAIGLAELGVAIALNTIFMPTILAGPVSAALVVPIWLLLHFLALLLGMIASGLQSIRLQYVECFKKFYIGGGVLFKPFGYARKYTTE
jgi:V/A-type H+-transporting ATPase subunit I